MPVSKKRLAYWREHGIVLVLSGGSVRAMAHLGLATRLKELGIPIKALVGSSGGAIAATILASQHPDETIRKLLSMRMRDLIRLLDPSRSGMRGMRAMRMLERLAGYTRLEEARVPLWINTTDLETGEAVVYHEGPIREIVRASMAIPGVFRPVAYDDRFLIDGDVSNPYNYTFLPYPREDILISTVKHIPLGTAGEIWQHPTLVLLKAMSLISQPREEGILQHAAQEGVTILDCTPGRIFTITPRSMREAYQRGYACARHALPDA